jgi:hypothetical protein
MKIDKVIFASDDSYYLDFWPLQAALVRKNIGVTPVLFRITDNDKEFYNDGHGLVMHVDEKRLSHIGVPSSFMAQIVRLYGTRYFLDDCCLISDIDMLMIDRNYFIDTIKEIDQNDLVIYCSDAYDKDREECQSHGPSIDYVTNRYPMCYIAGLGKTFNKIQHTDIEFDEFILDALSYGFEMWDSDELVFGRKVDFDNHGVNVHKLKRGYSSRWRCPGRIERPTAFNHIAGQKVIDIHCAKGSYVLYRDVIEKYINVLIKKDLIIISAYCNTPKKEDELRNLVEFLAKEKTLFDVMVVSHTPIPIDIARNCEWAIYDKKNERLEKPECIGPSWTTGEGFEINSIYACPGIPGSYHVSIWRMMATGNSIAKMLGYEKVHHIEYDTEISNLEELYENSRLLDSYDVVKYTTGADGVMLGCYMAYCLSSVSDLIKEVREDEWIKLTANAFFKNPETLLESIITKDVRVFTKHAEVLPKRGIAVNKSMEAKSELTWCFPYYDSYTNSLSFYIFNDTDETVKLELIYNNTLITRHQVPGVWSIFPIDENYENAKELTVITNGVIRQIFQFDEIREHFKGNSYIIMR